MEHVHGVDIYDIYAITYEPWWLQVWFLYTVAAIGLGVLGLGIYLAYRYKKQIPLTYDQKILQHLVVLSNTLDKTTDGKQFYCTLTDLLKEYLSHRFTVDVTGLTDEELLQQAKIRSDISETVVNSIQEIMQGIEIIKFGRGHAVIESMKKSLIAMHTIMQTTKIESINK